MPIPTDRFFHPRKLGGWFAVAGVLFLASIFWATWADYDRPWRGFQNEHLANEAALNHLTNLEAGRLSDHRPILRTLVNLPLIDFITPRDTPGRHQVNQLVVAGVRQSLNYVDTPTTDRCRTCHVAIDDPAFAKPTLAKTMEHALPALNEALERADQPRVGFPAPPASDGNDALDLEVGRVTAHWDKLTESVRDSYFTLLANAFNGYLEQVNREEVDFTPPFLAHPHLNLYVSADSAHPMAKMGCTVCHEGNGQETDFVLAAHTPFDKETARRWKEEYYVCRLGIPRATFEDVARDWDRTMLPRQYVESGCAQCHPQIADLSRFGARGHGTRLDVGRHLFANLGCINCHQVDLIANARRVGPDLTQVGSKLEVGFVRRWIRTPPRFRPSTRMPHFFDQENNRAEAADELDPEPARRVETEIAAITEYLFAVSKEWVARSAPEEVRGKVLWGRELFESRGCLACHANITEFGETWITSELVRNRRLSRETARTQAAAMSYEEQVRYALQHLPGELDTIRQPDEPGVKPGRPESPRVFTRFAPELSGVGAKTTAEWLYSWVIDPARYAPDTKMPSMRLSSSDAAHLAAYLATLRQESFALDDRVAGDADQAMVDRLLSALLSAQLSRQQTAAILNDTDNELTNLIVGRLEGSLGETRARRLTAAMPLDEKRAVLLGSRMIGHYGCYSCHRISGFEDTPRPGTELSRWADKPIAQLDFAVFAPGLKDTRRANPEAFSHVYPRDAEDLIHRAHGRNPEQHITTSHAAFARHKLLNPRIWDRMRPKPAYEKLRMPNFYLLEKELDALVTFVLSRRSARVIPELQVDYRDTPAGMIAAGRSLARELNCVGCHEIDGNAATIRQYFLTSVRKDRDFDDAPPSLQGVGAKVQSPWLLGFLEEAEPIRPWLMIRMPSFHLTDEQRMQLARHFVGLSQEESAWLDEQLSLTRESGDEDDMPIDVLESLGKYALDRLLFPDAAKESVETLDLMSATTRARTFERVAKLQQLYDLDYPAVEVPDPTIPAGQIADGQTIFLSLHCSACHVFRDPRSLDEDDRLLAPNLQPVFRRLRREWVRRYLEKPRRTIPHTYMPDLFGDDLTSPFTGWSAADRQPVQARLRDTQLLDDPRKVIDALTAFLFDAGVKGRTDADFAGAGPTDQSRPWRRSTRSVDGVKDKRAANQNRDGERPARRGKRPPGKGP